MAILEAGVQAAHQVDECIGFGGKNVRRDRHIVRGVERYGTRSDDRAWNTEADERIVNIGAAGANRVYIGGDFVDVVPPHERVVPVHSEPTKCDVAVDTVPVQSQHRAPAKYDG